MGAVGIGLDVIEAAAPMIVKALPQITQDLLALLPAGTVKVVPPDITAQVAVAHNLQKALPAFSDPIFKTILEKVGKAVAIYKTEPNHLKDDLQGDAAWEDIEAMTIRAIGEEGLDTTKLPRSTLWCLVLTGIEMYRAGAGVKAITV